MPNARQTWRKNRFYALETPFTSNTSKRGVKRDIFIGQFAQQKRLQVQWQYSCRNPYVVPRGAKIVDKWLRCRTVSPPHLLRGKREAIRSARRTLKLLRPSLPTQHLNEIPRTSILTSSAANRDSRAKIYLKRRGIGNGRKLNCHMPEWIMRAMLVLKIKSESESLLKIVCDYVAENCVNIAIHSRVNCITLTRNTKSNYNFASGKRTWRAADSTQRNNYQSALNNIIVERNFRLIITS